MLTIWESVETILLSNTPPSDTPRFPVKAFSTPGAVKIIIIDDYHWIRIMVRKFSKGVWEAIWRDNLTTKRYCMFYRCAWDYIISYKIMSHKKTFASLYSSLFNNITIDRIEKIIKDFKTPKYDIELDSCFLGLHLKEKQI